MITKRIAKTYRFPYGKDEDGFFKATREMTKSQYKKYGERSQILYDMIHSSKIELDNSNVDAVRIYLSRFVPISQLSEDIRGIPYPAKGREDGTVGSGGGFLVVAMMVINYFEPVKVTIDELLYIASYGDWNHKNGTWHHFIDVICEAYGANTVRLSSIQQSYKWIKDGGLSVALLDNEKFPDSPGNCLVFITDISLAENYIMYYYPGKEGTTIDIMDLSEFVKHTKILWGMKKE